MFLFHLLVRIFFGMSLCAVIWTISIGYRSSDSPSKDVLPVSHHSFCQWYTCARSYLILHIIQTTNHMRTSFQTDTFFSKEETFFYDSLTQQQQQQKHNKTDVQITWSIFCIFYIISRKCYYSLFLFILCIFICFDVISMF